MLSLTDPGGGQPHDEGWCSRGGAPICQAPSGGFPVTALDDPMGPHLPHVLHVPEGLGH